MAFIVVQHLDPSRPGMMAELLQRQTPMPVVTARNRMKVQPGHVYVRPSDKDISILRGRLYLLDPATRYGIRQPIDFLFRSLAADIHKHAVGVVLSGMGSDGTIGLRAIREENGLTLAQEPGSAGFGAMPESAIKAGLVDIVATVQELPERIRAHFVEGLAGVAIAPRAARLTLAESDQIALEQVIVLLRERTGSDFSLYKRGSLARRIERRMSLQQITSLADYVLYMREHPEEADLLFNDLLINVTRFFRDPAVWKSLLSSVLPALFAAHPAGRVLRAWVPACSSGEDAYSLAIIFREALLKSAPAAPFSLQIFATDLDQSAIEQARSGLYPASIAIDVPPEHLSRYFTLEDKGYRINQAIRDMMIFATHNVVSDPQLMRLDLLVCRNLLVYLSASLQRTLLKGFHRALTRHGILMLGSGESVGSLTNFFVCLDSHARIYRRMEQVIQPPEAAVPPPNTTNNGKTPAPPSPMTQTNMEQLRDEADRSREGLTAANEELQSANEELQAMNEEMSTSREELQSLNEELGVLNAELKSKIIEMSAATSDLENLINSTGIATVFLDQALNIRRFTPHATSLFRLLPVDVGRPLSDIASVLDYPQLHSDAEAVLRTLVSSEKPVATHDGRHISVCIVPYRSVANLIDGVVMTCTDMTVTQLQSIALHDALRLLEDWLTNHGDREGNQIKVPKALAETVLREVHGLLQNVPEPSPPPVFQQRPTLPVAEVRYSA